MEVADVLGSVLRGLQQESIVFCHAELSTPWGFTKARLQGAPFHAVMSGSAWVGLELDGNKQDSLIQLKPGDFIVLPHGDAHTLTSEPGEVTVSFTEVLKQKFGATLWQPGSRRSNGPVHLTYGGGGVQTTLISGVFAFMDRRPNPLVEALPRVIHIPHREGQVVSKLNMTLQYLAEEATCAQPGATAITTKLADILLIQAIRAYLALHPLETSGWLRGMTDPQIGRALALIHAQFDREWTVAKLAKDVGVSRAGFAARFKHLVGQGPIEYLTYWRMHEAASLLLRDTYSITEVAAQVGYRCDVAFSKSFKRRTGKSPIAYRREQTCKV